MRISGYTPAISIPDIALYKRIYAVANIYVVYRTIPELLKGNLKAKFKITRITISFKIIENIDSNY